MKVQKVVVHFEEVEVDEKDVVTLLEAAEISGMSIQHVTNRVARVDRSTMATAMAWYQDSTLPGSARYTSRKDAQANKRDPRSKVGRPRKNKPSASAA